MPLRGIAPYAFFYIAFALLLLLTHAGVLDLPYFWDEMGQFIPAALDIFNDRAWIPRTTLPNVHPPGVMAYLAGVWSLAGYSVTHTRVAMLLMAAAGVLAVFALAIQLGRSLGRGVPAFTAVLLLLVSPLFYAQSMMAQLDMPAMVFTAIALVCFLRDRHALGAIVCTLLVLMKESSIAVPAVFGMWLLLWERGRRPLREAFYYTAPAIALAAWLLYLRANTGHLLGNPEFTHYNVGFQLHPVRLGITFLRRLYYIFIANGHVIGTAAIYLAWRRGHVTFFRDRAWKVIGAVAALQTLVVTVLGGAALERYLMPVLPLFYIAVAAALTTFDTTARRICTAALAVALVASTFINPVFPFPYENNAAFIDFVELQKDAASYIEANYPASTVTSAWPFPDALRRPQFGYVTHPISVRGIDNFNPATVRALKGNVEVLVIYSRTWEPAWGAISLEWIRRILAAYYFYEPQASSELIRNELGLLPIMRWERRGQWIEIYAVSATPNVLVL